MRKSFRTRSIWNKGMILIMFKHEAYIINIREFYCEGKFISFGSLRDIDNSPERVSFGIALELSYQDSGETYR